MAKYYVKILVDEIFLAIEAATLDDATNLAERNTRARIMIQPDNAIRVIDTEKGPVPQHSPAQSSNANIKPIVDMPSLGSGRIL
jgi:hypothetical protein